LLVKTTSVRTSMLPRISIDQPFPVATRQKEECEIQVLTPKEN
jgi:hypothetical protein